jgi:hypothetical protein
VTVPDDSPFLSVPEHEWLESNAAGFTIADRYPVAPGHTHAGGAAPAHRHVVGDDS